MRMRMVLVAASAALALAACKSMSYDAVTTEAAAGGAQLNTTGLTLGYVQTDTAITPVVDQKGNAITVKDDCGGANPLSTYSILHGNATASTTAQSGQSAAIAVDRGQAVGEAATELARAEVARAVGSGYDVERAARDCSKTAGVLVQAPLPPIPAGATAEKP